MGADLHCVRPSSPAVPVFRQTLRRNIELIANRLDDSARGGLRLFQKSPEKAGGCQLQRKSKAVVIAALCCNQVVIAVAEVKIT
jgi:hypothetical protein